MRSTMPILLLLLSLLWQRAESQGVQTNGPHGRSVDCIAVSGTNLFDLPPAVVPMSVSDFALQALAS